MSENLQVREGDGIMRAAKYTSKMRNMAILTLVGTGPLLAEEISRQESKEALAILIFILILYIIWYLTKQLWTRTLLLLKMIEPDGRQKSGFRTTSFGKFMKSISWILIFILLYIVSFYKGSA
jgi:hypothetical protein